MAIRYTGEPFPYRQGMAFLIEPERAASQQLGFEHAPPS
jgi:hypothetical protein